MEIREKLNIYFELVGDSRHRSYITYKMPDILFILICSTLCGLTEPEEIIEFVEEREEFFLEHTKMEQLPCLPTLRNILKIINPIQLELCLSGILRNVFCRETLPKDRQIIFDGKTARGTETLHIVTALLADYSVSLGQITVDERSNEIPAVRELLDMLDIKGAVVTMDAMHCQKETIAKVIENKADYVVQLKSNQGNFYKDVYAMFDDKYRDEAEKDNEYETFTTIEKGHGRIEKRTCYVLNDIEFFTDYLAEWKGLKKIFAVKRTVEKNGKISEEISCYLSSKNTSAENLLSYSRKHRQIESFHWLIDVNYGEDDSLIRHKNSQTCLNVMRKYAISILKKYIENNPVKRKTLSGNTRKCLMNQDFMTDVLMYYCREF